MSYTVIKNLRMIVGDGRPAIENAVLAFVNRPEIKDDQLIYCGPAKDFDPQLVTDDKCFELDLSDGCYTVLPGLINTHVHLDLELPYLPYLVDKWGDSYRTLVVYRRACEALLCGVTTVRGVGIVGACEIALKKAIGIWFGAPGSSPAAPPWLPMPAMAPPPQARSFAVERTNSSRVYAVS